MARDPELDLRVPDEAGNGGVRGVLQRPRARLIMLIAALAIVAGSIVVWRYFAVRETTDDAQIDGHITPISARVRFSVTATSR